MMTLWQILIQCTMMLLFLGVFMDTHAFSVEPIANLKVVETNIDNEPDGDGDYRIKKVTCGVRVMARAGDTTTTFRLYITYNGGQLWRQVDSETAQSLYWQELSFNYAIADEAVVPDIQAAGTPLEFDAIGGIKITADDGSGEATLLTVLRENTPALNISLVDGEFENPDVLTIEACVKWKEDVCWPENENEDLVLYTIGNPATIPIVGQAIPTDLPLAANAMAAQGAYEVWRYKRCSGSWGIRFMFVNFHESRLCGVDEDIGTAILVRGEVVTSIEAISVDSYQY